MSHLARSLSISRRMTGVLAIAFALTALAVPVAPAAADGSPTGMVAFFNGSACPSGWSTASYATGRLVVAINQGKEVKAQVGKQLQDREDREHDHGYSTTIDLSHKSISAISGCCNNQGAKDTDSNTASGTTNKSASGLPFTQLVICEKG